MTLKTFTEIDGGRLTDKGTNHGYLAVYEMLFASLRDTRTRLFYEKCLEVFLARPIIPGATFQGANHTGEPQPPSAWEWERVWQLIWDPQYTTFVRY